MCNIHPLTILLQCLLDEGTQSDLENLVTGFLSGVLSMDLIIRLSNLKDVPSVCCSRLNLTEEIAGAWIAWSTRHGAVAARGSLDVEGSRRIQAYLLRIEWVDTVSGYHALWAHCDPKRPTEWTVGRGRLNEPH
jgi:hypothetical protein